MEHIEAIIFIPYFALTAIVLALTVWLIVSFRKIIRRYENKNKQATFLDNDNIQEKRNGVQYGEQQFVDMYQANN